MSVDIRPAQPADAQTLTDLARRSKATWGYPPEWLASWAPELTFTRDYLAAHASFVAEQDGATIGMCVLETSAGHAKLQHVWVAPESHGRGAGRTLVARALEQARGAGVTRVEVESDPFAEAFYLKLGAHRIGSVPAPMPGAPERVLPVLEFTL